MIEKVKEIDRKITFWENQRDRSPDDSVVNQAKKRIQELQHERINLCGDPKTGDINERA